MPITTPWMGRVISLDLADPERVLAYLSRYRRLTLDKPAGEAASERYSNGMSLEDAPSRRARQLFPEPRITSQEQIKSSVHFSDHREDIPLSTVPYIPPSCLLSRNISYLLSLFQNPLNQTLLHLHYQNFANDPTPSPAASKGFSRTTNQREAAHSVKRAIILQSPGRMTL